MQYTSHIPVGCLPKFSDIHDPNGRIITEKQSYMKIVDMIPVYFTLNVADLFRKKALDTIVKPVSINFTKGIKEFNKKLAAIKYFFYDEHNKLQEINENNYTTGIRAWVNNDSSATDTVQNNYKENKIADSYNSFINTASQAFNYLRSTGFSTEGITNLTSTSCDGLPEFLKPICQGAVDAANTPGLGVGIGTAINTTVTSVLDARQLSLPKIWDKTDYSPSITLNIRLFSVYGNKQSVVRNVISPLLGLTALVTPSSYDGITSGVPPYIMIRMYGSSYMTLSTLTNISFNRGNTVNSKFKQPQDISVSLTFASAFPGFGSMVTNDICTMDAMKETDDVSGNDYIFSGILNGKPTEDFTGGNVPGLTTLGSIIESFRTIKSKEAILDVQTNQGINSDYPNFPSEVDPFSHLPLQL